MAPRALGVALFSLAALAALFAGVACVAVPDLRFIGDGGADARPSQDGSPGTDGGAADAGGTCAAPEPAGGTCCGSVWCFDSCGPTNCDECARAGCAAGLVCCGKTGTVQCKAKCP